MAHGTHRPICGKWLRHAMKHRCDEKQLRAIDGANTRALNEEFETESREPFHRTEGRRLAEGFEILGDQGDNDG